MNDCSAHLMQVGLTVLPMAPVQMLQIKTCIVTAEKQSTTLALCMGFVLGRLDLVRKKKNEKDQKFQTLA
jgi:hypothetical protein